MSRRERGDGGRGVLPVRRGMGAYCSSIPNLCNILNLNLVTDRRNGQHRQTPGRTAVKQTADSEADTCQTKLPGRSSLVPLTTPDDSSILLQYLYYLPPYGNRQLRGAGVGPTKGLSEKSLNRSLSSIHILYNHTPRRGVGRAPGRRTPLLNSFHTEVVVLSVE